MKTDKDLWVEKYRPTSLDEYVFQDDTLKAQVEKWIENGSIPHLCFFGSMGTGKTTLARIIANMIVLNKYDFLILNGSKEGRKIDSFNEKVEGFTQTMPYGKIKICLIDEADRLNLQSVQPLLRNLIERFSGTCRFIFTCNHPHLIMPEVLDRFQKFHIERQDKGDFTARVAEILLAEEVEFDVEDLYKYIDITYPSMRSAIHLCEQNVVKGHLNSKIEAEGDTEVRVKFVEMMKNGDFIGARKYLSGKVRSDEMGELFAWMYNNLNLWADTPEREDDAILIIRNALVNSINIAHPDIHVAATVIDLLRVKNA